MRYDEIDLLKRTDLNLLVTLLVLLQEKHVSNAANILCITQPAVSKNLKRLREVFADPLLVRVKNKQIMTPKAEMLKAELIPLVQSLNHFFSEQKIDLTQVEKSIVIMASDYASPIWINTLVTELNNEAPNMSVSIKSWSEDNMESFYRGEIDFAFGLLPLSPAYVNTKFIANVPPALLVNNQHPLVTTQENGLETLAKFPLVKIKGGQQFDQIYSDLFINNSVLMSQASLWLAIDVVKKTNAIMLASQSLFTEIDDDSLTLIPLTNLQSIKISLSWHKRLERDYVHRWLRNKISAIGEKTLN